MAIRKVIIEIRSPRPVAVGESFQPSAFGLSAPEAAASVQGIKIDPSFSPMPMPPHVTGHRAIERLIALEAAPFSGASSAPEPGTVGPFGLSGPTYLVRGEIADLAVNAQAAVAASAASNQSIVGIYADVAISTCPVCPNSPALGSDKDVERLLGVDKLARNGMDGTGVCVAVVDTGINVAWLNSKGKTPNFDASRSFTTLGGTPGNFPVNHGTMCAFDVCIAAPKCTLLDIAILRSVAFTTLLSDAVRAYSFLLNLLRNQLRPGAGSTLVVSNSWARFPVIPDFPKGHPSNYSDNPNHPFNRIVDTLESVGADILFAAGNCGPDCPDDRCYVNGQPVTNDGIYGANSHPKVLSIGGVDINGDIAGYSTLGPGHLDDEKPDVCAFTHFSGSGVYAADGGTSAATPVAAGLIAALRTKKPSNPQDPSASPQAIRSNVSKTAVDKGPAGFDYTYGWGIVNGPALADLFAAPKTWTTFISGSLEAGETEGWYSDGWSKTIPVDWRVVLKGQSQPNPQLTLVSLAREQPDGTLRYTLDVTNRSNARVDYEVQYGR
jgi:hypothetical protein